MFKIDVIFGKIFYYLFVFVLSNNGLREHSKQDFSNKVAEIHLALAVWRKEFLQHERKANAVV
jgi:hypothetical protein